MASRLTATGFIDVLESQLTRLYGVRDELLRKGQPADDTNESINEIKKIVEDFDVDSAEIGIKD
jgi:hypothetical protein